MLKTFIHWCLLCGVSATLLSADSGALQRAREQYNRTNYQEAVNVLAQAGEDTAAAHLLAGQAQFMLGDFKKAVTEFERAVTLEGGRSEHWHWLGRAYGRRAETANMLSAPGLASKARQAFEKAVQLDGKNIEALNDLFSYYLEAPGFLGGGEDRAVAIAQRIAALDPAESAYAQAQIAQRHKDNKGAEQQLRRAMDLAPRQVGRVVDLAKFLARQGRTQESDAVFEQAARMAPGSPQLLYARAEVLIDSGRDLAKARDLLQQYLRSPRLTPDDPSRLEAQQLLQKASRK